MDRGRVKQVNRLFLLTVVILLLASMLPLNRIIKTELQSILFSQAIVAIPGILYLISRKTSYSQAIRLKKISPKNIIWLILFSIAVSPILTLVNMISMLYSTNMTNSMMTNLVTDNMFFISLIAVAVVPAIIEETVYRGVFYNEYRLVNPVGAIFLSAFLFGILHGNFNQFSYAFLMGIIFAFVIEATDSILSTMILHFLTNGTSVVILSMYPKMIAYLETIYNNAIASGNDSLANQVHRILGTTEFDATKIMSEATKAVDGMSLGTVLSSYGLQAIIGGIIAFFIYRKIAKNTNRWDYIKGIFAKKNEIEVQPKQSLFSILLIVAIVFSVLNMEW